MVEWKLLEKNISSSSLKQYSAAARLLLSRGIAESEIERFLEPNYEKDIHDPFLFSDMEKVVDRINLAKEKSQLVAIYGDYDADGVTSSAIIKEALTELGVQSIVYIPDKKNEGYGMNLEAVSLLAEQNVKLIITVDCGITGIAEVKAANKAGIDVIITDHHHVPQNLPDAFAIINPNQQGCGYPFAQLAGVGVAFKVAQAIFKKFIPEKENYTKWMLDLVAIGTVADCVPLIGENRTFVKYGLIVLSKTKRRGLLELFQVGRVAIDQQHVPDTRKISFQIAPRINAAGRIDHANLAYNLLMEDDIAKARDFALELETSNIKRQKMTEQVGNEVRILANNMFKDKKFIFAVGEHFPVGVVGLVAGKIAQEFNKPTAVLCKGEFESSGSFRSIPQINIIESIEKCSSVLEKFGGHSQAAGVTISNEKLEEFYEMLSNIIEEELEGKDLSIQLTIDLEITPSEIDFELIDALEKMEPFGEGNSQPQFLIKNMLIADKRVVGNGNKHIKFLLKAQDGSPKIFDAIGFGLFEKFASFNVGMQIDVVCNLSNDEWNGNKKIQLTLIDARLSDQMLQ